MCLTLSDFKPIWSGKNWELLINDKDEFVIYDIETHAEIEIMKEDKQEFQQLIAVLSNEFWQESVDFRKGK